MRIIWRKAASYLLSIALHALFGKIELTRFHETGIIKSKGSRFSLVYNGVLAAIAQAR